MKNQTLQDIIDETFRREEIANTVWQESDEVIWEPSDWESSEC